MCWRTKRPMLAFGLLLFVMAGSVQAYTPNDPAVRQMVERGLKYLEGRPATNLGRSGGNGGVILGAYAHYKCRHDPDSPVVKQGLRAAELLVEGVESGEMDHAHKRNYEISVAVLLMAEVDVKRFKPQLQTLQRSLMEQQFSFGGFGYPGERQGDVSQTQYALLAIWTLDRNGIPLDYGRVVNAIQWLLRVQDPSGVWPYKGKDPGIGKPRVVQTKTGMSMALAGGSSVLIAGDALRLWGDTVDDVDTGIPGLPDAIKIYKEDKNTSRRKRAKMSQEPVKNATRMMDGWRNKNPYKRPRSRDWYYYLIYTLERYESFVEIANGRPKDSSPDWYNKTVDELRQYQGAEGGWADVAHTDGRISTSFALLFLIRSTQKAIFSASAGSMQGGRDLPSNTADIRVNGTQITGRPVAAQVEDLLKILEDDDTAGVNSGSLPDDLQLANDPKVRAAQLDRFERLVRGSRSWQARRVAAKLLSKSDELRVVPALIYALSDRDKPVQLFARDGLRFLSRKFEGFGMSNDPSSAEIDGAQQQWRDWYRTINPKHVFLDYDL